MIDYCKVCLQIYIYMYITELQLYFNPDPIKESNGKERHYIHGWKTKHLNYQVTKVTKREWGCGRKPT